MFRASVARSYARGLAGSVPRGGESRAAIQALVAEYRSLLEVLRASPDLQKALASPSLPALKKSEILAAVLESAAAAPVVRHFATLVAANGHAAGFEAIGTALEREAAIASGIVEADVRVALPVGEAETTAIASALARALGRPAGDVRVQVTVDPSLVGGFVARAGDLVFDGSIARQMERLRAELVAR